MRGTKFRDGVLVDQAMLQRDADCKADEILRNRVEITSRGVISGGTITPNAINTDRLDITVFEGMTPRGDHVQSTQAYTNIVLDDYTAGVDNYLVAVYTEALSGLSPHETDGQTYTTRAETAFRIRAFSAANFAALADEDENLANDAVNRCLILGVINANGVGAAITASDITHPTAFYNLLYAVPNEPPSITGVTITGISSDSNTGTGTLDYTYAVGPVYTLTWTDPITGAGAAVNPTVDGSYTLYGGGAVEHIIVDVVISQLPLTTPHTENILVSNLYEQDIPRFTAHDHMHRNYLGTGILTPNNPHAYSEEDLTGSTTSSLDEHQDVQHNNGIWRGSSATIFWPSITLPPTADVFQMIAPAAGDLYYVNGEKLTAISPTSFEFLPATIPSSAAGCHFYEIYVDDNETAIVHLKASYPNPRNVSGTWIIDMSEDFPAGNYDLTFNIVGATYTFELHTNGASTTGTTVVVPNAEPAQSIKIYDENGVNWIELWFNTPGGVGADANPPGAGPVTDTLVVNASLDRDENMQLHSLTGWWNPGGAPARFQIGYPPYAAPPRNIIDKRPYGNLCEENIADSFLQKFVFHPEDELHFSGVLMRRTGEFNEFKYTNVGAPSLDLHIGGGYYYCRGQRLTFDGDDVTLAANKIYLLYADMNESLQTANVTDDFAGNLYDAMEYILGSTKYVPARDDEDHYYDNTDPPERGVILYYVQSGAASITTYCNMMRNVNGPVDPWSVAKHGATAGSGNISVSGAFDNLYSAFAYANLALTEAPYLTAGIDMRIVGNVVVDREITQPSNVRVWGTRAGSSTDVEITHVSANGAWIMSNRCVIDGVYITNQALTGAAIRLDDDCIVRNCEYHESVGGSYEYFLCNIGGGVGAVNRILVENNYVSTKGGLFVNMDADANIGVTVRNNTITQTGHGTVALANTCMIRIQGYNHIIKDNKIETFEDGANAVIPFGVYLDNCTNAEVEGNTITLQQRDGSISEIGVMLYSCDWCRVLNNYITMPPAAIDNSDCSIGIDLSGGSEGIEILNNQLYGISLGVYGSGAIEDISVCGNRIKGESTYDVYRGIYFSVSSATLKKIRIEGNTLSNLYKANASVIWPASLYGIVVSGTYAAGATTYSDISICENIIDGLINTRVAANADAVGVYVGASLTNAGSVVEGVKVCRNNLKNIEADTNDNSIGISLELGGGFPNAYDFETNGNIIHIDSDNGTRTVIGIYYNLSPELQYSTVNDNDVFILGSAVTDSGDGIIITGNIISDSSISNNSVSAPWVGIYAENARCSISGNAVQSGSVGIFGDNMDKSEICDNTVSVYSYNQNPYGPAGTGIGGGDGAYCIVVADGVDKFLIADNYTHLENGTGGNLLDESANIWAGGDVYNFSIDGNTTKQAYTDIPAGGRTAYHIYVFAKVDGTTWFAIKNNNIDNLTSVPANTYSHGIYIDFTNNVATNKGMCHVVGNTIMGSALGTSVGPGVTQKFEIFNQAQGAAGNVYVVYQSNVVNNAQAVVITNICSFGAGAAVSPGSGAARPAPGAGDTNCDRQVGTW